MWDFTKEIITNLQSPSEWAKRVQDESLCFGCSSALYGLTKLFYDLERKAFDEKYSDERKKLKNDLDNARIHGDLMSFSEATSKIEALQAEKEKGKENVSLKFFYINFFDLPPRVQQRAEAENWDFAARLDTPDTFGLKPELGTSDLRANIFLITISDGRLMSKIRSGGNEWTEERRIAKEKQRWLTAHEMAHRIFRRFDPDGKNGLDCDKNADKFAEELLKLRKYYINGSPGFPRVKLNHPGLASEFKEWLLMKSQAEFTDEVASEMTKWLESSLNQSEKQLIEFDKADAD